MGGPSSAQVFSVENLVKGGRSKPLLAATSWSLASGCGRCINRLFAADLFLLKSQVPQKNGSTGAKRPLRPDGMPCVQHCSATLGASRLATAHALGGLRISAPRPEISHLLLEVLSQAGASGGKKRERRV